MSEPVTATIVDAKKPRKKQIPWYLWVGPLVVIYVLVVAFGPRAESRSSKPAAEQVDPELRAMADNMVEAYQKSGVISSVTSSQATVSDEWYSLSFENKKQVAGALKTHYNATHYKFVDMHTGKTVAEYGEILGFRVH